MADIVDLRKKIDALDKELVRLFLERMDVCRQVGRYKAENNLPVLDERRERELVAAKVQGLSNEDRVNVEQLFNCIMDVSKKEQFKLCGKSGAVGFTGIEGAYGYFAAKQVGDDVCSYSSFEALAAAVERGEVDRGVLPIENTTSGSVLEVYDILGESSLYIVEEIIVPVSHCLLGLGTMEDVESVCSHHQALTQCSTFLNQRGYKRIESVNTAVAAKECKDKGDKTLGAIASASCGKLYGLKVLKEAIEDRPGNKTRFVVVARDRSDNAGNNKASVTFTLPHRQGALIEMLSNFKSLNMTKIESRPVGDFEYRFYVDFMASNPEEELEKITKAYNTVKVLGVYKGMLL